MQTSLYPGVDYSHVSDLSFQLFDDLASWRGEFKKAAASLVRSRYDLFPPLGSRLSKTETRQHVKRAAEVLIKKSAFAHGGKDDEVLFYLPQTVHEFTFDACFSGTYQQFWTCNNPRTYPRVLFQSR